MRPFEFWQAAGQQPEHKKQQRRTRTHPKHIGEKRNAAGDREAGQRIGEAPEYAGNKQHGDRPAEHGVAPRRWRSGGTLRMLVRVGLARRHLLSYKTSESDRPTYRQAAAHPIPTISSQAVGRQLAGEIGIEIIERLKAHAASRRKRGTAYMRQ